ncbi:MAG: YkgJ family cysteine cluster protein [Planctomycetota bacterium]
MSRGKRLALAKGVRFACRQCGDCCRHFPVSLSSAEVERFEATDWTPVLGIPGPAVARVPAGGGRVMAYLRRKPSGECLFLGADSLCDIHRHLGEQHKPLACRMFPFRVADGPEVELPIVGGHFACSALAHGEGEPLTQRRRELERMVGELHAVQPPAGGPPPALPFQGGLTYAREDVALVLDLVARELEGAQRPFPERILAVVRFLELVAGSRFSSLAAPSTEKAVRGFAEGTREHVVRGLLQAPAGHPPLPQRLLFRSILAFAARRDTAALLTAGTLVRAARRVGNLLAGFTFLAGSGLVRCVGRERPVALGEVRRRAPPADPRDPAADGALTRYFLGQVTGRFLYAGGFQVPEALPALGLLVRQYPVIVLFARAACLARGGTAVERDDWVSAVRTADWNFGQIPWTRGVIGSVRARLLADLGAGLAFVPHCAGQPAPAAAPAEVEP